jgi:hypothetical protein
MKKSSWNKEYASRKHRCTLILARLAIKKGELFNILVEQHALFGKDTPVSKETISKCQSVANSIDYAGVEMLALEMAQWRENMEGTNLENTDKFGIISKTAEILEGIQCSTFEIELEIDAWNLIKKLEEDIEKLSLCEFPKAY